MRRHSTYYTMEIYNEPDKPAGTDIIASASKPRRQEICAYIYYYKKKKSLSEKSNLLPGNVTGRCPSPVDLIIIN